MQIVLEKENKTIKELLLEHWEVRKKKRKSKKLD